MWESFWRPIVTIVLKMMLDRSDKEDVARVFAVWNPESCGCLHLMDSIIFG